VRQDIDVIIIFIGQIKKIQKDTKKRKYCKKNKWLKKKNNKS
jgi:hypothetical protein